MAALMDLVILAVGLVILWVVLSLPVYAAARLVTSGRATFGQAMWATLGGGIVFVVVLAVVSFFLGALIGRTGGAFALLLAFLSWLALYRSIFRVGWMGALAIAVLAAIVAFVLAVVLVALTGASLPIHQLY
ncbi:MAG: hypothetical protein ABSF83_09330 [Nitrososphaerales archaeon]|jgi:hypothetical protein